jgi:hypothetical protein
MWILTLIPSKNSLSARSQLLNLVKPYSPEMIMRSALDALGNSAPWLSHSHQQLVIFSQVNESWKLLFEFGSAMPHDFSCGLRLRLWWVNVPRYRSYISRNWPTDTVAINSSTLRSRGFSIKSAVVFFVEKHPKRWFEKYLQAYPKTMSAIARYNCH